MKAIRKGGDTRVAKVVKLKRKDKCKVFGIGYTEDVLKSPDCELCREDRSKRAEECKNETTNKEEKKMAKVKLQKKAEKAEKEVKETKKVTKGSEKKAKAGNPFREGSAKYRAYELLESGKSMEASAKIIAKEFKKDEKSAMSRVRKAIAGSGIKVKE